MTVYLAFNEAEALVNGNDAEADTDMAVSGVARAGFRTDDNGGTETVLNAEFPTQAEVWVHFDLRKYDAGTFSNSQPGYLFKLLDDDDNKIVGIYYEADRSEELEADSVLNGTLEAINLNFSSGTLFTVDVHAKINASGFVRIYLDNVLVYEYEGDTVASTSATGLSKLQFIDAGYSGAGGTKGGSKTAWGQVVVSDENTLGAKVYTLDPSAGTTNEWGSGTVTDVDEQGVDDSDQMLTNTALDEVTFDTSITLSAVSNPEKFTAVVQSYRASLDASATPTGLTPLLFDGATTSYYASSPSALTTSLTGYQEIWSQDPSDTTDWTAAKINGYEFGYRADS